jgi:DNA-binding MarR family transcriptional regulator
MNAHARRTDPATSHEAAAEISTRVTDLELKVLAALVLRGPSTTHELAEYIGLSLVTVSPRMAPLELRGMVKRAGRAERRTLWDVTPRALLAVQ